MLEARRYFAGLVTLMFYFIFVNDILLLLFLEISGLKTKSKNKLESGASPPPHFCQRQFLRLMQIQRVFLGGWG